MSRATIAIAITAAVMAMTAGHAKANDVSHLEHIETDAPIRSFPLGRILREISGLVRAGPSSVFAHGDEYAIIHEIDLDTGAITRSFALGKPTAPGDFEGVVLSGGFIYLVTSDGKLFEAKPADHRRRANYNVYDTGLGETCEIEGVAADEGAGDFFFLCKRSTLDPRRERLIIYRWSIANRLQPASPWLNVALADLDPTIAADSFRGSEITRDDESGHFFILDSRSAVIIELDGTGGRVASRRLQRANHPQPEGLAIMGNGDLVVGDEGGARRGRLTLYRGAR